MKKNLVIVAAAAAALCMASCHGNTKSNDTGKDSLGTVASDSLKTGVAIESLAGTYEGTLPAADCPGIRTVLTLNADSTYQYVADYLERKDGHDETSGVLRVIDGKVLVLVRPSSGEQTYYKVKDDQHVVMTDSLGNEPEGEMAKLYVLTKTK